jgi:hypothetical protein
MFDTYHLSSPLALCICSLTPDTDAQDLLLRHPPDLLNRITQGQGRPVIAGPDHPLHQGALPHGPGTIGR